MDSSGRLYSQVAAEAGVAPERAMVACYLADLSRSGKSLNDAATLMRKDRSDVRTAAREWGIRFSDYEPDAPPVRLEWTKAARGRWELLDGRKLIAVATSDGKGGYRAATEIAGVRSIEAKGSSAEVAVRRLSRAIERQSAHAVGAEQIEIIFAPTGDCLAPKLVGDLKKMRKALAVA
jgi:hypothetical protein